MAMYAAKHLHLALKETEAYGKGDLARGLEESFLALDRKMLTKEAAAELRAFRAGGEGGENAPDSISSAEEQRRQREEMNATFRAALIEQVKGANPDIDEKDLTFDFELDEADIATASSRVTDGDNSHWSGPQAGATSANYHRR